MNRDRPSPPRRYQNFTDTSDPWHLTPRLLIFLSFLLSALLLFVTLKGAGGSTRDSSPSSLIIVKVKQAHHTNAAGAHPRLRALPHLSLLNCPLLHSTLTEWKTEPRRPPPPLRPSLTAVTFSIPLAGHLLAHFVLVLTKVLTLLTFGRRPRMCPTLDFTKLSPVINQMSSVQQLASGA